MAAFTSIALGAAALGAVASGAGAIMGANSAGKAAKAQQAGLSEATAEQRRQFDLQLEESKRQFNAQRSDLAPYRNLGTATLPTLKGAYGLGTSAENAAALERFRSSTPDYGFGFSEGQRATEGALNASGMGLRGGGALKALTRYGQDYATTRFGNWRAGLGVPAGYGSSAVAQGNQASQNYANSYMNASQNFANAYGQNAIAAGNARASAYGGTANALGQIGQTLGYFGGRFGSFGAPSPAGYTNNLHLSAIAGGAA